MKSRCSMHMLWNAQIIDTCIVFPQWHIKSTAGFIASFFFIIALGVLYESLRQFSKLLDLRIAASLAKRRGRSTTPERSGTSPIDQAEEVGLLEGNRKERLGSSLPIGPRLLRAFLYGATVFLSFFLMLVFMTYNAYLILAVVVGATLGHFVFGAYLDTNAILSGQGAPSRSMPCH